MSELRVLLDEICKSRDFYDEQGLPSPLWKAVSRAVARIEEAERAVPDPRDLQAANLTEGAHSYTEGAGA